MDKQDTFITGSKLIDWLQSNFLLVFCKFSISSRELLLAFQSQALLIRSLFKQLEKKDNFGQTCCSTPQPVSECE